MSNNTVNQTTELNRIFKEAVIGYGFEEVEQTVDGVYCTGCGSVHKRPTKLYQAGVDILCKYQVIRLYNPEVQ